MELEIVNPQPKYPPVTLIDPAPYGYVQMSAAVDPPRGRIPFPGRSSQKTALLTHLARLSRQLEGVESVEKATVYRAIVTPPPNGYAKDTRVVPPATTLSCSWRRTRLMPSAKQSTPSRTRSCGRRSRPPPKICTS